MTDTQIVNAIQARIDGRFDDPDLMLVGALHDRMGDIVEILSHRGNTSPNLLSEAEVYKMTARRAIAEMEQPSAFTLAGTPRLP